ncbi:SCL-interrupting locus protein homolog isoform X2 [Cebidichthys violaceus]|uniref:SCL-interrupting locus protein homolog isoform X2 n=1 Tax=Cebidichthys violaceus TaxID=271503 RepID=UPI0035C947B4
MSCPVDLQALPSGVFEAVLTPENVRGRTFMNSLSFPKSRSALWDGDPAGEKLRLQLCAHRKPRLVLLEKALRLAQRHARHSNKPRLLCFLLGSVCVDADEGGVTVTLDRFDPGRDQTGSSIRVPSALLPGDVLVPCWFSTQNETVIQSEAELHRCFKALQQCVSSRQTLSLSQLMKVQGLVFCSQQSDAASFVLSWSAVCPSVSVDVQPVRDVPIIPTALLRSLTSINPPAPHAANRQRGFLTMDQTRKLLLLLESDPKASKLPLVGLWLSGVTHVSNPQVWAWCVRFLYSSALQDRVLSESRCFLLVLFASTHRAPQFFQCRGPGPGPGPAPQLDYQLLTASQCVTLYQVVSVEGRTLRCELGSEDHSRQTEVFREARTSFNRAAPPAARLSVSDQDSGVEDEDLSPRPSPSPHPPAQQARRVRPSVPELSLLIDSGFSSNHNARQGPGSAHRDPPAAPPTRNTTSSSAPRPAAPPHLHSTPNSNLQEPCSCCSTHTYNCTSIFSSSGLHPLPPSSHHHTPPPSSLHTAPHPPSSHHLHTPPPPPSSLHPAPLPPSSHHLHTPPPSSLHPAPPPSSHHHTPPPPSSLHPAPPTTPSVRLSSILAPPLSSRHQTPSPFCTHPPHSSPPPPSHLLPPPPCTCSHPPHAPCCDQVGGVVPSDTYQLLLHQDRQLRLLQAQVQMLLEAQGTLQSSGGQVEAQTPRSIAVETGESEGTGGTDGTGESEGTGGTDGIEGAGESEGTGGIEGTGESEESEGTGETETDCEEQLDTRLTLWFSGASLFWGNPVQSPLPHRKVQAPPTSSSSHADLSVIGSVGGDEDSEAACSPSGQHRCSVSGLESPVLGESVSMYRPDGEQQSFYHTLKNQLTSRLQESDSKQEVEVEEESSRRSLSVSPQSSQSRRKQSCGGDPVLRATMRQLQQLGVDVDREDLTESKRRIHQTVEISSVLASINPAAVLSRLSVSEPTDSLFPEGSVDLSLEANAIALRYLSDSQLSRLSVGGHAPRPGPASNHSLLSPSNMSLATRKYMRRYGLIEEEEEEEEEEVDVRQPLTEAVNVKLLPQSQLIRDLRPKMQLLAGGQNAADKENRSSGRPSLMRASSHQTEGSVGNILDLSRLRQLPKLF